MLTFIYGAILMSFMSKNLSININLYLKSELKYQIPGHITKLTRTIFRRSEVIDN